MMFIGSLLVFHFKENDEIKKDYSNTINDGNFYDSK